MKAPLVLVIRSDGRFSDLLRQGGCEVMNLELIETVPANDLSELDDKLARLNDYDGLFFTSPVAASIFVQRQGPNDGEFSGKIYVLGERSKIILEQSGFEVVYRKSTNTAAEFIESFDKTEFIGKKLLFVRGDKSMSTISRLLGGTAAIDEVIVYNTREILAAGSVVESVRERLHRDEIDWACFFSPSGIENFRKLFSDLNIENLKLAVIGDSTAQIARRRSLNVQFVSKKANAEDFAAGLIEYIKNIE